MFTNWSSAVVSYNMKRDGTGGEEVEKKGMRVGRTL